LPTIYLASPLGFAASTRDFMTELATALSGHVTVINPWDDHRFDDDFARAPSIENRAERLALYHRINTELGRSNAASIDCADGVVAILDGVDVDSGTAAEIGYGFARGKRVEGLRTDFRLAGDNEGSIVNLQVQYFIEASGGHVHTDPDRLIEAVAVWANEAGSHPS
jgi:nucleoside 2-deoxyribosyltransferase